MTRILLLTLPLLAACGPRYCLRVPDRLVQRLPYETRIELLEAENDLALAIHGRDEAANDVTRARDSLRLASERLEAAEDEEEDARDAAAREVAQLAVAEARARVEHLRARQHRVAGQYEVETLALRCALARFELERLTAARRAKVEGSERLDPKDFERQHSECEAEVKAGRTALAPAVQQEKAAREAWQEKRAALAKKTFDARASPYVEAL